MRKIRLQILSGILVAAAAVIFLSTAASAVWVSGDTEVPAPALDTLAPSASPEDYPIRLRIPALTIDAHVQHVGINAKGNMASPSNFTDVGWYKYGTPPGYLGSAVVAGHVDNGLGLSGVFKNLSDIKIGDDVIITAKDGREFTFRVTEIQIYPYKRVPLDILFSRKDLSRLNLITCEGSWVSGEKTYDQRLIIFTELVQNKVN